MNILLKERCLFDYVLPPEKVKKCLSRMSGKLSRTVLRRGRESNLSSLVEYTSIEFTDLLKLSNIRISMDGKGRAQDNVFVERLWRTVKQEEVYLRDYRGIKDARKSLIKYFEYYNTKRRHQSLDDEYPEDVYYGRIQLKMAS